METPSDDKEVQPTPGRCTYFVKRKRRYCKLLPAPGKRFCGEHLPRAFYVDGCNVAGGDDEDGRPARERIPCPLDPKHTVYSDQLKKHMKKCNARETALPAYHVKSINRIGADEDIQIQTKTLSSLPKEELLQLIDTVKRVYRAHPMDIPTSILSHPVLQDELTNPMNGSSAKKHLCQVASLMGQLQNFDLLGSDTCYVEFGAGRGQMSHWVQQSLKDQPNISFLLVDRAHVRHKFDTTHRFEKDGPSYERIRIDIEHLCLGKVPSISDDTLVTYSKHLCGAATDLTLHCLMETLQTDEKDTPKDSSTTKPSHSQVKGIVIALCCHHRCDWSSYVGRGWWLSQGLTAQDFVSVSHMSSWATCGPSRGRGSKVRTAKKIKIEESRIGEKCKERTEKEIITDESKVTQMSEEMLAGETFSDEERSGQALPETSQKEPISEDSKSCDTKEPVKEASSTGSKVKPAVFEENHQLRETEEDNSNNISQMDVLERRSKVSKMESNSDVHSQGGDISAQRLVGLNEAEREDIGCQCKRLIDMGRMAYLEGVGFKPRLVYYVDRELSLENIALVALPSTL